MIVTLESASRNNSNPVPTGDKHRKTELIYLAGWAVTHGTNEATISLKA